jgi:hypothetical protein
MKRDIRDKWVENLLSGKYKQGEGVLRCTDGDKHSYCCLGVLCDILDPKGWDGDKSRHTYKMFGSQYLSNETLEKVGMLGGEQRQLSHMNDIGDTFETIAAWIQRNL